MKYSLILSAVVAGAYAQSLSSFPECVQTCLIAKVTEGYCATTVFQSAYNQCLSDNCGAGTQNYNTGAALSQSAICAAASSQGVTATQTLSGSAAGSTAAASATSAASGGAAGGAMSGSATASQSAASSSSSASGNSTGNAAQYLSGLNQTLTSAGLTTLAGALGTLVANNGSSLAPLLSMNSTVLAPNNAAFAAANASSLSNQTLAAVLSYHLLNASLANASSIPRTPNVTFARSFLSASPYVLLGGAGQVVKLSRAENGTLLVGQSQTPVLSNATYMNLMLDVIGSVLQIPGNISSVLSSNGNYSSLVQALNSVSSNLITMLQNTPSLTILAPTNNAFSGIASALPSLNATQIQNVLLNHIINGTVLYSPLIQNGANVTSAAGNTLTVARNSTGIFITTAGNVTAQVVSPDNIVANGVVHGIDAVLVNTASNPSAAAAAASSAQAASGAAATQFTGNSGSSSGSSGSGGNSGSGSNGSGGSGGSSGASHVQLAMSAVLLGALSLAAVFI